MPTEEPKTSRVLELYHELMSGKAINKQEIADRYHVNVRSIQRDIDSIRSFLANRSNTQGDMRTLEYDKRANAYKLVAQNNAHLSPGEVLAACKILLESRAFSKEQLTQYLQTVLELCIPPNEKEEVQKCIANELFHYHDPAHPAISTDTLWLLSQAIRTQVRIDISYLRMKDKQVVERRVNPVGLLFSEYYFYLMAVIENPEVRKDFDKKDDPFPTIYRVDRIQSIHLTREHFSVPYVDRFKEGEYKNRVQYMYGGEPQKLVFEYYGPSIEAVLDRFPTAAIEEKDGVYTVTAEVFGNGVVMWLLSQGSKVKVVGSEKFAEEIKAELHKMLFNYD